MVASSCVTEETAKAQAVTTMMCCNVPRSYNREVLIQELGSIVDLSKTRFLYLPMDKSNRINLGYGFVDFKTAEEAEAFRKKATGHRFRHTHGHKTCFVKAARHQGMDGNLGRSARQRRRRLAAALAAAENAAQTGGENVQMGANSACAANVNASGMRGQRTASSSPLHLPNMRSSAESFNREVLLRSQCSLVNHNASPNRWQPQHAAARVTLEGGGSNPMKLALTDCLPVRGETPTSLAPEVLADPEAVLHLTALKELLAARLGSPSGSNKVELSSGGSTPAFLPQEVAPSPHLPYWPTWQHWQHQALQHCGPPGVFF